MRFSDRYMVAARKLQRKLARGVGSIKGSVSRLGRSSKGSAGISTSSAPATMAADRETGSLQSTDSTSSLSPTSRPLAKPSLFSLYKDSVDAHNPAHLLSTKTLAQKKWRVGLSRSNIARRFGAHNSGAARLALSKSKAAVKRAKAQGGSGSSKVHPMPVPSSAKLSTHEEGDE